MLISFDLIPSHGESLNLPNSKNKEFFTSKSKEALPFVRSLSKKDLTQGISHQWQVRPLLAWLSASLVFFSVSSLAGDSTLGSGDLGQGQVRKKSAGAGRVVSLTGDVLVRNEQTGSKQRQLQPGESVYQGDTINTGSRASVKLLMTDETILDLGPSTLFEVNHYQLNQGPDRQVQYGITYGKVRTSVNRPLSPRGRFFIKTKSAIMGVRGTEFIVSAALSSVGEASQARPSLTSQGASGTASGASPHDSNSRGARAMKTEITVVHGVVDVRNQTPTGVAAPVRLTEGQQMTTVARVGNASFTGAGATVVSASSSQVKQLSADQLKATTQEAKVQDNTFAKAITMESFRERGAGEKGLPHKERPAGFATVAAVNETIGRPEGAPPIRPGDIRTPGVGYAPPAPPPPNRQIGVPVKVQVVFVK